MDIKKALIYHWHTVYGGAERCNESFNTIWPDLEHFALIDFLNSAQRKSILKGKSVKTTFILKKRVNIEYNSDRSNNELLTSRYSDFYPLNDSYKYHLVHETKSSFEFNLKLILAHYGQYLNHGFFEMDNIIRNKDRLDFALGRHTFSQVFKPFSFDINANPRAFTFVTFFGSFYLDFGWGFNSLFCFWDIT